MGQRSQETRGDTDIMSADRNMLMRERRHERKWKEEMGGKGRRIGEADKGVLEALKKTELEEQKRRLAALNTYRATAD